MPLKHIALGLVLTGGLTALASIDAQEPAPLAKQEDAAPQLTEKDRMTLTLIQQQIENATLRMQLAMSQLKRPGWHVDSVGGQWIYVPDAPEKK